MNRNEAIAYLTRCADDNGVHWSGGYQYDAESCPTCKGTNDAGWLACPGSRYGRTSADVAPIAYRHAVWYARETGQELADVLDGSMSRAVNDHPDIETDLQGYAAELAGANVDAMVDGYLDAQLWAGLDYGREDDGGNNPPLDENYSRDDIADEYVETVRAEIAALVYAHPLAVRMYLTSRKYPAGYGGGFMSRATGAELFGHDFYLTREGHGAGFWDRGLGELGDYLTQISKWAGSANDLDDRGDGVLR